MIEVILKRFSDPDEVTHFAKGKFETVRLGGMTIGRATYEPGWKWTRHVGPAAGKPLCDVEHVGLVLSGTATVAFEDGRIHELTAGTVFHVGSAPHDSWVVGDDKYVSLHFLDAGAYASA